MIIEEISISLFIDNLFSNKQILIFFCSLTVHLAHAVGLKRKKTKKMQKFIITMKPIFKTGHKENSNVFN